MRYKRQEAFRYQLSEGIEAEFTFQKGDYDSTSKKGQALIHDISPNGLRFHSEYDLPVNNDRFVFNLKFILNDQQVLMPGQIIWKKKLGSYYGYGFKGLDDLDSKQNIIELLKKYSRHLKK